MSDIKRILFVDDECENYREDFNNSVLQAGVEIIYCPTKDDGISALAAKKHYDLVLLDWFLEEPDTNILSLAFLAELRKAIFIPVFIWTQQYDNYQEELSKGTIPYPKDLIIGISKEEFEAGILKEKVKELYDDCKIAHLSKIYRETVYHKLEEVFFELSEIAGLNLIKIIKSIVGETKNIDWSNDFILNFIHRRLISDNNFIEKISLLLSESPGIPESAEDEIKKEVINKILYYKPSPNRIRCGDIINIKDINNILKIAIIVSPDCDLATNKTRHIELVELRKLDDEEMKLDDSNQKKIKVFNHTSYYFFPSLHIDNEYLDFVALLKSKLVLTEKADGNNSNYPKPSKQLDYNDYFVIGETLAEVEFICRLDEPYKSDFLNHLHSHNLRVGIPDIKKLWS